MADRAIAELTRLVGTAIQGINDLRDQIGQLDQKIDGVQGELTEFRQEVNQKLDKIEQKINHLAADVLDVRAENSQLERRITEVERKPS